MNTKTRLAAALLAALPFTSLLAQEAGEAVKHPLLAYEELTDTKPVDGPEVWARMSRPTEVSWGSTDVRYKKGCVPQLTASRRLTLDAWRGQRVGAQLVVWSKAGVDDLTVSVGKLTSGKNSIAADCVKAGFVRYVMTDELNKDGKGGCGNRANKAEWDSSLVADVIDINKVIDLKERTAQPVWVTVSVPRDAAPGLYRGEVTVSGKGLKAQKLTLQVEVASRTLAEPKDWGFHLDLWQNPYAVARYYEVPLWSDAHFEAMRPIMKMLADAGQKVVTATIMDRPWAGQTEDPFSSMVGKRKNIDGTWSYDYTVFDRWVSFMRDSVGITSQINCYTMIPWALTFDYYDQATGSIRHVNAAPGEQAYADYWQPFLTDFAAHLKQKGWFDVTTIAMDERPMEAMREAIKVIKASDPDYKVSLAGNYHAEIEPDLYDYCIAYGQEFPAEVKARRDREGKVSTVYTCCSEPLPNTFTFSDPIEAVTTPLHAEAAGYDGYLRWAVNSWTADPLRDSRFRTWAAGDCYSIYPGPRSSIRFERFVEGLQLVEQVRELQAELAASGNTEALARLNAALKPFAKQGAHLAGNEAVALVEALKAAVKAQ